MTWKGSLPQRWESKRSVLKLYLFSNKMTRTLPSEIGLSTEMEFILYVEATMIFMDPIPQEVNNMLNLQIFSLHASLKKEWVS
jgi:hypothetical protein